MNANKIITLSRSITDWKSVKEMHRTGPAATRKMLFHPAAKKLINGAVSSKKIMNLEQKHGHAIPLIRH